MPVDLLRIRPLAFAVGASACTFAAQMASYVSLPFYFQQVLGRPYLEVGMLMGAWPVGTALIAPLAGRLARELAPAAAADHAGRGRDGSAHQRLSYSAAWASGGVALPSVPSGSW